ncbi:uncharacterized protein VNE69_03325 [Vairimorpha necatrix]|uniref:Uncharacterized protein n=1 Tax=Vairimorpha necatrix TaxID=6039 RepID=A0AAX4JAZ3_9MICR
MIKKNMIYKGKVSRIASTSNLRCNSDIKNKFTQEKTPNYDLIKSHSSSAECTKKKNETLLGNNDKYNEEQPINEYVNLLENLESFICECNEEDMHTKISPCKLKFADKNELKLYRKLKQRSFLWINNSIITKSESLSKLDHLIKKSKIDEKTKKILLYQLDFCYNVIIYINSTLPLKEKHKHVSLKLLSSYGRITKRFPILFYKMNLQEVFSDFHSLLCRCLYAQDSICLEMENLEKELDHRFYITYRGLDKFIGRINNMSKILTNLTDNNCKKYERM